jgi:hypothetical protein
MASNGDPRPADENDPRVHVRLAVGGVGLEYRGGRGFYRRRVLPLVEAAYRRAGLPAEAAAPVRPAAVPEEAGPPAFKPTAPWNFRQFTAQVGDRAATVEQRIMAFAFYLWNFEKQDEFRGEEIEAFFRTVQEDPPSDLDTRLGKLTSSKRFLESGGEEGTFRLSSKGVNYVKNRLLG